MIPLRSELRVLVATQPVDFRAGMDRLAALAETVLKENPFAGEVFVFRSTRRANRLKLLMWDGTGLILATKRLEDRVFTYLHDVLERIVSGRTKVPPLDELLAWNWTPAPSELAA